MVGPHKHAQEFVTETPFGISRTGTETPPTILHVKDPQNSGRTLCGRAVHHSAVQPARKFRRPDAHAENCSDCQIEHSRRHARPIETDGGEPSGGVGTPVVPTANGSSGNGDITLNRAQIVALGGVGVGVGLIVGAVIFGQ